MSAQSATQSRSRKLIQRVAPRDGYLCRVLPEPEYLDLIGELAYKVSYLEWGVIGDLAAARDQGVITTEQVRDMQAATTAGIARQLRDVAGTWHGRPKLTAWAQRAAAALEDAAEQRNHVLHARPATDEDGRQRLLRDRTRRDGTRDLFWITSEFLREQVRVIDEHLNELEPMRWLNAGHDDSADGGAD